MAVLTTTSRGQVTFRKEVLQHLGIQAGEKVEFELLPNRQVTLRPVAPKETFATLNGLLKHKTNGAVLSIDEMNEAIAEAGAKAGMGVEDCD